MNKNSEKPSQISSDFEAIHFFARRTILLVLLSSVSVFSFSQFTDSGINLGSGGYNNCIWGDYDNDGDQDILLSGYYSKIFRNNGNKTFTEISVPFNVIGYTATWIDFDNDNDLDIFLGNRLYKNMGGDIFKEVLIEDMNDYNMGVSYFSSVDVKDYDNDGDEDLLIGYEGKILIFNNRDGKFLLVDQRLMGGENLGNLYINNFWIDAYNTGYYDILYSKLYKNNSRNLYSPDPNFNINGAGNELSVADYNSDGFMDALFTGYASASIMMKNINGTFTNANLTSLMNVYGGGVSKFGDYNNDGQVDFILDGSLLFTNTGSSDFTKSYPNLGLGSVWDEDWGDFDNDGDLDLILTSGSGTKIFENGQINTNIPPPVPSNLVNTINGNSVTFSWDRPIDAETPSAGLTYNICLINVSINDTIKPPGANLTTGKLLEPKAGNTQSNNFWKIKGLKPGDYKWTVQAIDHSFAGSAFAIFNTFQITSSCTVSPATTQVIDPNLNGSLLTVTETVAVTSRIWAYSLFPGGPYTSIIQGATNTTYTPNFQEDGRYFIMCKSVAGSDTLFSNEIMVEVLPFTGTSVPGIPNYYYNGSMKPGDSDNDGDLDLLITGNGGTNLYVNTTNSYSPVSITTGLINGYAAWFDYNNDNKLDFIITGTSGTKSTRIFINQGNNAFSELTHDIIGLEFGSIDAGDYDHDGDPDIIICGKDEGPVTKIYRNDNGIFTDTRAVIGQVTDGMAKWVDYDKDGDLDVFISGTDFSGNPFTALYRNDATAGFVQLPYKFKPYKYSFTDFGDYNNDGNIDILLAGSSTDGVVQTIAYKNLGGDQFMEIVLYDDRGFNFVKWLDYNNDGLLDVLLVGNEWYSWSYAEKSCKYHILKNCGDDVFKEIVYRKPWVNESQLIALADFDNDSDVDVIQSAIDFNTNNRSVSAFYNKSYVVKPLPAPPVNLNSIRRGKDIILNWDKPTVPANKGISYDLMVGTTPNSNNIVTPLSQLNTGYRMVPQPGFITDTSYKVTISAKGTYYWQVQAVNNSFRGSAFSAVNSFDIGDYFIELTNPFLPLRYDVTFDWGDYDNDGDQDLLLSGMYWVSPDWKWFSYIYENLGNGTFNSTLVKDIGYQGYKLKWIDIDNDNDLDIAGCMGANGLKFIIFENTGAGVFSEVYNTPNYSTDFSYGDFDNNGLTDFFISSNRLLINKGNFTFEERYDFMVPVSFEKVSKSFFDLDNDLDLDMVAIYQGLFVIYENKNHSFVQIPLSLPTFRSSVTDFDLGDLDNDGDLDIIITGNTADGIKSTLLLRNDGKMKFTEISSFIRGTEYGAVSLGDYDNDNDLDILLSGNSFSVITKVYENKGNFSFEEMDYLLPGQWQGKTGWSDFDEDGDLDLIIAGTSGGYGGQSKLYRNDLNIPSAPVYSPSNLNSETIGYGILLSWKDSLNSGISYNVRVGSQTGFGDIVSPMADLNTGKRKVAVIGNADLNKSYRLDSLPVGTYFWSVQAINGAFKGGPWATEQSFTISVVNAAFSSDIVCNGDSTHFIDNTITSGESLISWKWYFSDGNTSSSENPVHLYANPGTYSVKLVVHSASYADSVTNIVVVKPTSSPDFTASIACQGTPTSLTNNTNANGLTILNWLWNFGDGLSSTLQNPGTHGYLNPGNYTAELWVFADNGCAASVQKTVTIGSYPVAVITANAPLTFCKGDSVTLSVPYNNTFIYTWKADGINITGADSSNYLSKLSGNYNVEVVNPVGTCKTISGTVAITAQNAPIPPLISAGGSLQFCQGDSVTLSVTNTTGYSYQWKLNGGAVGTNTNQYNAKASGTYSLFVSNSSGCMANSTNSVNVVVNSKPTLPTVNISGPTSFCQGGSIELSVTNNPGYTYQWENNGATISGASNNIYVAQNSGIYSLKILNSSGCDTKTENVTVNTLTAPASPEISAGSSLQFCQGDSVNLSVTNTTGYSYQWKLNGGAVGINSNQYNAKASGTYSLFVSNSSGCTANSTNSVNVVVNSLPSASAVSLSGPATFCSGGSIIMSIPSTAGYFYNWRNESGLISGANTNSYNANTSGKYQLDISNSSGCIVTTSVVNVVVKPVPLKPLIISENYQPGKCLGETPVKLKVSDIVSGYNYQWYMNRVPITNGSASLIEGFITQGDYAVEAEIDGCKVLSDSLKVYFENAPEKPLIYATGPTVWYLSCSNDSAMQYKWYYNGNLIQGADKYLYVANQKLGKYNVSISNTKGCFTVSDTLKIPLGGTGIADIDPFAGVKIYPNPTPGLFTIEMDNPIFGELKIDIFNQGGKEILNIKFEKTTEHFSSQINLKGQAKGVYIISLQINGQISNKKIIIE